MSHPIGLARRSGTSREPMGPADPGAATGGIGHADRPDRSRAQDTRVPGPPEEGQNGSVSALVGSGRVPQASSDRKGARPLTAPSLRSVDASRERCVASFARKLAHRPCGSVRRTVRDRDAPFVRPDDADRSVTVRCAFVTTRRSAAHPVRHRSPPRSAPPARAAAPSAGPDGRRVPVAPRGAPRPRGARRCAHHRGGGGWARRAPGAVPARRWLPGGLGPRVPRAAHPPEPGHRCPGARAGLPARPRAPVPGRSRGRPCGVPRSSERGT